MVPQKEMKSSRKNEIPRPKNSKYNIKTGVVQPAYCELCPCSSCSNYTVALLKFKRNFLVGKIKQDAGYTDHQKKQLIKIYKEAEEFDQQDDRMIHEYLQEPGTPEPSSPELVSMAPE